MFLDIQMPKLDGFEVAELAGAGTRYVFVTAFDRFALRAFEIHAIDYLLKPFSRERLAQALAHARTGGKRYLKSQRLAELEGQLDPAAFLRIHRSWIVNVGAIRRIEPAGRDNHCAVLDGDVRLPISRSGYQKVRDLIR